MNVAAALPAQFTCSKAMWWKEIVLLIALLCAPFGDGATQFDLSFTRSTNKVVVTDYYYLLEYAVIKGTQERWKSHRRVVNQITITVQMIAKFNQSHWERVRVGLWKRHAQSADLFCQVAVMKLNSPLRLMSEIIRSLASPVKVSGEQGDDCVWHQVAL